MSKARTRVDGDLVVQTDGALIADMDIEGVLRVQNGVNITIKNCVIRGGSDLRPPDQPLPERDTTDHVPCIVEGSHIRSTRHTRDECLAYVQEVPC
jgi:hypothetical protein